MKLGIVFAAFGLAIVLFASDLASNPRTIAHADEASEALIKALQGEAPGCVDSYDGLVSWWSGDFDADDVIGNNAGTLENGAAVLPALVKSGFTLDGEDDFVLVPDSDSLDIDGGLTFNAWLYWEGFTDADLTAVIASKEGSFEIGIRNFGGAQIYANIEQVGGKGVSLTSEESYMPIERWVFLSMTYDAASGEMTLSLDGTPLSSTVLSDRSGIASSDSDLSFGARDDGSHFQGQIDEVELYNRGLSRDEIETLIASRDAGKCSGSLTVVVDVASSSAQPIDVYVNGKLKGDDVDGEGIVAPVRVTPGAQTIELTNDEGYYLVGAETTWECRNDGDLVIRWDSGNSVEDLPVATDESIVCTASVVF
jgi:hypothetical protein